MIYVLDNWEWMAFKMLELYAHTAEYYMDRL